MNGFRLILLIGGLLFIGVLIWLERRRPNRVQRNQEFQAERNGRNERNEPVFGFADETAPRPSPNSHNPAADPRQEDEPGMTLSPRGPDPGRALPLIDWSTPVAPVPAPGPAPAPDEPALISVEEISAVRTVPREEFADEEDLAPLRVDWPAEAQRQIVSLRVVAARQNRISGRLLRQGLSGAGFQHGEFGIFHLGHSDGRVALSAASLVRPGLLDPAAMDFQSFSGVNLFAVLPGPLSNEETLERLTAVATELALRVEGRVQDERGMPFDSAHPAAWRERALTHIGERRGD